MVALRLVVTDHPRLLALTPPGGRLAVRHRFAHSVEENTDDHRTPVLTARAPYPATPAPGHTAPGPLRLRHDEHDSSSLTLPGMCVPGVGVDLTGPAPFA